MSLDVTAFSPPRFDYDDAAGDQYLKENGYVVYKNAATPDEISKAHGLFWDFIESLGTNIKRTNPKTWHNEAWPQSHQNGAIAGHSVGHTAFLWYCRGLEPIRNIFARLWGTPKLLVSFDGCGAFRPTSYEPTWQTKGGWYHFDQNGAKKFGLHCYQGMLNLVDAGAERGGLVVVPKSHLWHELYFASRPDAGRTQNDFIRVTQKDIKEFSSELTIKICCEAGDFIVWDSRTVHCNTPALTPPTPLLNNWKTSLDRLVAYICMTPLTLAHDTDKLLSQRQKAISEGITTNHWPHEFHPNYVENSSQYQKPKNYTPPSLNEAQRRLAGLLPYD
jgi:hypothetical protein